MIVLILIDNCAALNNLSACRRIRRKHSSILKKVKWEIILLFGNICESGRLHGRC